MNAGIPQHPPPIVILRYLGKQVLRWAPLLLVLQVTGFKSLTFGALVLTLLAIMWSAAWSRIRSAGGIPLYGPFMVDPNSSSTSPPTDAEPATARHSRRPATNSHPSFSFTEAMASYFPFRFDNPEVSSPVPDVVRISQTRILLTRLLPDELIDPIMRHAGLMFDHLSERDEGRPIVYHDSSGQIWAMEDRQAREQRWIFLRSRPLVGPTDVEFARSHGDQAQEEGGEEVHVVQDVDDEQKEEDIVVDDDRNKRNPWRIKRITIMTNSRDQGWSNDEAHHGTYAHAYSWFEVVVERNGVLLDGEYVLQYNMHASGRPRVHLNDLPLDHPLFRKLKRGDRLILLAKARFPGWTNVVYAGGIDVFYGY